MHCPWPGYIFGFRSFGWHQADSCVLAFECSHSHYLPGAQPAEAICITHFCNLGREKTSKLGVLRDSCLFFVTSVVMPILSYILTVSPLWLFQFRTQYLTFFLPSINQSSFNVHLYSPISPSVQNMMEWNPSSLSCVSQAVEEFLGEVRSREQPHSAGLVSQPTAVKFLMARKFDVSRSIDLFQAYKVLHCIKWW